MRKTLFTITLAATMLASCGQKDQRFQIKDNQIGPLHKGALIKQVDSIFAQDSIVSSSAKAAEGYQNEVEIFDKEGNSLMVLSPDENNNPNSPITHVQITDARYETDKGIGIKSTFKDIKKHYTISKVETTFSSAIVFLENSPIYISVDKDELPEDIRYNLKLKVEPTQIPDDAKIKLFMVSWDID